MFLLGFRRKLNALALCKSTESAIQCFQIHHRITFGTIQNPAVHGLAFFLPWFPNYIVTGILVLIGILRCFKETKLMDQCIFQNRFT